MKEDIWNLELTNQDLSHQIIKLSQTITKLQLDKTKFRRENSLIQQELENLKSSQETFKENLQKSQQEHEEILAKLKKRLEHLQQEKEKMNNQLKQHIKEASVKTEQEASIELIKKEVIVSSEEITSLRFSLEQAHKVIKELQVALYEEKMKKDEIEKLLYEIERCKV